MSILARCVAALTVTAALVHFTAAKAQDYPSNTVKVLVGFAPGGGTDRVARLIAPKLSEKWGRPVIVENREGADGTIAADIVAKSKPDGLVLLMTTINQTVTPSLRNLTFDPIKDFAYITVMTATPEVLLINPNAEAKTLAEFITLAKANPGQINFGTTGNGGPPFIEMLRFMREAGIQLTPVPYKGTGEATAALLGNEIQVMFQNSLAASSSLGSGALRGLAITGAQRSAALPDMPTFGEAAKIEALDELVNWYGLATTGGTPADVVSKIYKDVSDVMHTSDVTKQLTNGGTILVLSTPEETKTRIEQEIIDFGALLKEYNVNK
ncbi:MAG: Bug family tripartite tricarboxylate transporter substrate binding protein [Phyllobacterium sp.]